MRIGRYPFLLCGYEKSATMGALRTVTDSCLLLVALVAPAPLPFDTNLVVGSLGDREVLKQAYA